ncbi:N-terminal_acetyltransferase complex ARD1 subunit [Hexamita inflata]|uniref:N-terminal acetyltransferase complex ARD1 subunit n=1 Tax=Hexamita inflata TaxID=28002 RepID=A0AA86QZK7_9EUKA|nr:N-terminal acetyltransferase complex ARD1 subunit [Hexamita inflata]
MSFDRPLDLYDFYNSGNVNQDPFTASFSPDFYCDYLTHFPEQCFVQDQFSRIQGYMIGKDEASNADYHIHVSAVTVAPEFRRQNVSKKLMKQLETVGDVFKCNFCDLFVRQTNDAANAFYSKLGYVVFRIVKEYYVGQEDAFDRRKSLKNDVEKKSVANAGRAIKQWVDYEW